MDPGLLMLLVLLAAFVMMFMAGDYWWVILLMTPGVLGVLFMPHTPGDAKAAGFISIGIAYVFILGVLAISGSAYLFGNAVEARRPGAPPRRSMGWSMLYHSPLSIGIAICVTSVAWFIHNNLNRGRIPFAVGAAICLLYVLFRRIEPAWQSRDEL